MRKLIITEFISLDGVMEAPGGEPGYAHAGWVGPLFSDELGAYKGEEQLAADILLLGRVTYESFYGAWPQREGPMAEKINTMTKYVASRRCRVQRLAGRDGHRRRRPAGRRAQGGGWGTDPRRRQPHARAIAVDRGARRPAQPAGLPADPRQRCAAVPGDAGQAGAGAGVVAGGAQRRAVAELPTGRRLNHGVNRSSDALSCGAPVER